MNGKVESYTENPNKYSYNFKNIEGHTNSTALLAEKQDFYRISRIIELVQNSFSVAIGGLT